MNQALAVNIGTDSESGTTCSSEHRNRYVSGTGCYHSNRLYVRYLIITWEQILS